MHSFTCYKSTQWIWLWLLNNVSSVLYLKLIFFFLLRFFTLPHFHLLLHFLVNFHLLTYLASFHHCLLLWLSFFLLSSNLQPSFFLKFFLFPDFHFLCFRLPPVLVVVFFYLYVLISFYFPSFHSLFFCSLFYHALLYSLPLTHTHLHTQL